MEVVRWSLENWQNMAVAAGALCLAVVGVLKVIPGTQPGETALESIGRFLMGLKKPPQ
jgi:hypothetical protein